MHKNYSSNKTSTLRARPPRRRGFVLLTAILGLTVLGLLCAAGYVGLALWPALPSISALTDYQPRIPLRVYTADQVLIGEFGQERREFIPVQKIPAVMKNAILDIEDEDFYRHGGVDFSGIARAALANLRDSRSQGASTITMQVARTFLLSRDKTYSRKLQEIVLAYRIEAALSKDQILELYMNQIYLGERAYGFSSAARTYFGKSLQEVTIAEAAMLAGLPKAPSSANPVVNPVRARQRQQYILKRMLVLGHISQTQYQQALQEELVIRRSTERLPLHAEHAAEMVRQAMLAQYGEEAYSRGLTVYTTLTQAEQQAAYAALRRGVLDYDRRHGYRGPEGWIKPGAKESERQQALEAARQQYPDGDLLRAAVVLARGPQSLRAELLSDGTALEIRGAGLRLAGAALQRLRPGAVIRVARERNAWVLAQLPEVEAAFVALDAGDGAIRALVGGFDFARSQFDHASAAWRQPGSTIKPFIYSAALEKGFSPATRINDAPLPDLPAGNGQVWNPSNDDGGFLGPVTMREGLKKSRNLVSLRILQAISPGYARDFISRFGFAAGRHPDNLTMALGTGAATPLQVAGAYAVFANGGFRVAPYLIAKVVDARGTVLAQAAPEGAGNAAARVLDPRNAYLVDSMLRDVVRSGTAAAAGQKLGRRDLAGKTGTTSDAVDGWFAGYGGQLVGVAWMGYDRPRSLGSREFGSTLALPIWTDFMRDALRRQPETVATAPAGLLQVDGDLMYQEYAGTQGVRALGVEEAPPEGFLERLLRRLTPSAPAAPAPAPGRDEQEEKRMRELYFG